METRVNDYVVMIDDRCTLKSVRATAESTSHLDLSNLSLEFIDECAFRDVDKNVRTLNLEGNSLFSIPAFVFMNLTSLEHLSLANNEIKRLANAFAGLENLRTLDLTDNLMWYIEEGYFHGLTKTAEILLSGNEISSISSRAFEKRVDNDESRKRRRSVQHADEYYRDKKRLTGPNWNDSAASSECEDGADGSVANSDENGADGSVANSDENGADDSDDDSDDELPRVKIAIHEGSVSLVEYLRKKEPLPDGHVESVIHSSVLSPNLYLSHRGIRKFEKGWYRLKHDEKIHKPIVGVDLSDNEITEVTGELVNDLPQHVVGLKLDGNKIERLHGKNRRVFVGSRIKYLSLENNPISYIEDAAFEGLPLVNLNLAGNRLKDTRFAATLPSTLEVLRIEGNDIAELTVGSFAKLTKVHTLRFHDNKVATLRSDSLEGLTFLRELELINFGLTKIEPGAFRHLNEMRMLRLNRNRLTSLDNDVFRGMPKHDFLLINLGSNRLTIDALPDWPENLGNLDLSGNEIGDLKAGYFKSPTLNVLDLSKNGITTIERGSFDLPRLHWLIFNFNRMDNMDGDWFDGLPKLRTLTMQHCGITRIDKGFMKHLGGLTELNLYGNSIRRLDNGALFGIQKSPEAVVQVMGRCLEVVQGGVFDDV